MPASKRINKLIIPKNDDYEYYCDKCIYGKWNGSWCDAWARYPCQLSKAEKAKKRYYFVYIDDERNRAGEKYGAYCDHFKESPICQACGEIIEK